MKTHLEVIEQPPNESDPDGWSSILCGLESSENFTTHWPSVDCCNCLKLMEKRKGIKNGR